MFSISLDLTVVFENVYIVFMIFGIFFFFFAETATYTVDWVLYINQLSTHRNLHS